MRASGTDALQEGRCLAGALDHHEQPRLGLLRLLKQPVGKIASAMHDALDAEVIPGLVKQQMFVEGPPDVDATDAGEFRGLRQ